VNYKSRVEEMLRNIFDNVSHDLHAAILTARIEQDVSSEIMVEIDAVPGL
jgi:hypothetical protein